MYRVELDGVTLYDPRLKDYDIFTPKLKLEVNKAGAFDFRVYPSHPLYNRIFKLQSIVEVYQDDMLLFRGRVLDDEMDFNKSKMVICEGELAYFNDSVLRPYEFTGSVSNYLKLIVDQHNSQVQANRRFTLGNVTVTDPNNLIVRADSTYPKTWDVVQSKLIKLLGGYLMVRRENGVNYLDYLKDSNKISLQKIELGKNLLDLVTQSSASDVYTAILPLGAEINEDTGERLTIKSVNGGKDFIQDDDAVAKYGFIMQVGDWKDVTIASNLLTKARQELAQLIKLSLTLELTAIDLSMIDVDIDDFKVFEYVDVLSTPHGIDERLLVEKMEINLTSPNSNKITIGQQRKSLTDTQIETDKAVENIQIIKGPKGDKGEQGLNGLQGEKGDQGLPGKPGENGQPSYTHIAYANSSDGSIGFSTSDSHGKLFMGMYVDNKSMDSQTPGDYRWTLIKGEDGLQGQQGLPGKAGNDGKTPYLHIAYANNSTGTSGFSTSDSVGKLYIGQYTDFNVNDSTDPTKYSWTKIKGEDGAKGDKGDRGAQGIQGPKGTDGTSQYVHIRYSANADGSVMTKTPQSNTQYIGLVTTTSATAPATNTSYTWSKFKGDPGAQGNQGIPGTPGANGQTTYTWVKYADTATGTGMSDSPAGKLYIGLAFNKTTQTESSVASDYTWSLMPQNIEIGARNLLLRSTETVGYWIDSAGKVASNNGTSVSDYIAITPLSDYMFTKTSSTISDPTVGGYFRFAWYTEDKTYIARMANSKNEFKWTAPSNAYYIRISYPDDSQVKFEKGNVATDWTPAPEDIQSELDDKASNEYVEKVFTNYDKTITDTAKEHAVEVTKKYLVETGISETVETISSKIQQIPEGFNFTTTQEEVEKIKGMEAEFTTRKQYMSWVDGKLSLGNSWETDGIVIDNKIIKFMQNGVPVAWVAGGSFHMESGVITKSLQVGSHQRVDYGNGLTAFDYIK